MKATMLFCLLSFLFFSCNRDVVVVEKTESPSIEVKTTLNGLLELSPGRFFISSKNNGFFIYSLEGGWSKINSLNNIQEVEFVKKIDDNLVIGTKEQGLYFVDKNEFNVLAKTTYNTGGISDVISCSGKVILISVGGVFEYNDKTLKKFQSDDLFPLSADCNSKGDLLIGTRFSGLYMCKVGERSCHKFHPETETSDIRSLAWNEADGTWYVGFYGNVSSSVVKLANNRWENVGVFIGDVKAFYKDQYGHTKYVLNEVGELYLLGKGGVLRKLDMGSPITSSVIESGDVGVYALSFNSLVARTGDNVNKVLGSPLSFSDKSRAGWKGNAYVWDIEFIDDNIILAATGQDGVWWSGNSGYSWQKLGKNLEDPKIHFVKYSKKHNKIFAGTHTDGLYYCSFPCDKWIFFSNRILNKSDAQDADFINEDKMLIATEKGGVILDIGAMKVIAAKPLKTKETDLVVGDFLTAKVLNEKYLLGIHTRYGSPSGVWSMDERGKYKKFYDFVNEPVTGIDVYNGNTFISTLKGLYECSSADVCQRVFSSRINKITINGDRLIFAAFEGAGLINLDKDHSKVTWMITDPSHSVEFFPKKTDSLVIGTFDKGVLRIRLNRAS